MKININRLVNNNPYKTQQQKQADLKQEKTTKTDKVEISPKAKEMQASQPVQKERLEKVNQIKHQVETGTYQVKPDQVATKMRGFFQ